MKNQNTLLLIGAAVIGYIIYKKYTTAVTLSPVQNTLSTAAAQAALAAASNAYSTGLAPTNNTAPPVTAAPAPGSGMALTFDSIQNM